MPREGKTYFVTFIDDFFRYTRVYLIRHKDEAFNMFLSYKAEKCTFFYFKNIKFVEKKYIL